MKVLIIQENGRHKKNRYFRECFSLQKNFIKLGHEATVWGLGHDNFSYKKNLFFKKTYNTPDFNNFDLLINLENYDEIGWVPNISKAKCVKFLWSIDAHYRGEKIFNNEFIKGKYDLLLHSTKDYVIDNKKVWFPNAYDSELIDSTNNFLDKKYYVGFCGNYIQDRDDFYNKINQHYKIKLDIQVLGKDMVHAINSYKIHINKNHSTDINYRSFETIGCKTVLMTNQNYQYEKLGFIDGENYITYNPNDFESIISKLDYYNSNLDELEKICEKGYILAKKHTYYERVKTLIKLYDNFK